MRQKRVTVTVPLGLILLALLAVKISLIEVKLI
jgi:hypothetical protein